MSQVIPIHEIAARLELTSRTLRHWEEKGLFKSLRDPQSGWRVYDDEAVQRIRLVLLLRELDIPIKAVKVFMDSADSEVAKRIFQKQIEKLNLESSEIMRRKELLNKCLLALNPQPKIPDTSQWMASMENTLALHISSKETLKKQWEDIIMTNDKIVSGVLRIVTLPSMRVAVCNVISASPEDEALGKVLGWAESENLMGTARIFGFNTTPYKPGCAEYGWAASVTIPEQAVLPDYLEERRLPGGLYASMNSTNEVYDSWQTLVRLLKETDDYEADKSRPCLEEHIRSGETKGQGHNFYLNLLEPVRKKQ